VCERIAFHHLYKSYDVKGDQIVLTFDHVGSGLMTGKDGPLDSYFLDK
jgi:hypothetical protein